MNKSLKISATIHAAAKLAAVQQGLKLQEFVEQALLAKLEPAPKIAAPSADSCQHGVSWALCCKECRQIKK